MPLRIPVLAALLLMGCSDAPPDDTVARDSADQRARDSALSASGLPGATGIGAAMRVSDSAAKRRVLEDSISGPP